MSVTHSENYTDDVEIKIRDLTYINTVMTQGLQKGSLSIMFKYYFLAGYTVDYLKFNKMHYNL